MKKAALEELYGHHSEDEHEEQVDNQDVEHILQRVHHAVKHSLKIGNGGKMRENVLTSEKKTVVSLLHARVSPLIVASKALLT